MTKDEALKLALDFIENSECGAADLEAHIKEALAQPEHGWTPERIAGMARLKEAQDKKLAQLEPVAWEQFYPDMGKPKLAYLSPTESSETACFTPPQRTWVGLTEEELYEIYDESDDGSSPCGVCGACSKCKIEVAIARAIQAKLKEKNNG